MQKTRHTFVKTKLLFALTIIFIALAILGIVQAVKRKDRVLGRFLSIKLANALCISFIITISAILTFHLSYLPMRTFCIIIGTINTLIIFGISAFHLYSSVRQPKSKINS